jgi:hypothetical protein
VASPPCPACTAPGLVLDPSGGLRCTYCGSIIKGKPFLCPSCGWINSTNEEECPKCGEPMTVVAQVIRRQDSTGAPQWLQRAQSQAGDLKEREERASSIRIQKFMDIDRMREEALRKEDERQTKQAQRIFGIAIICVVVMILIALMTLLLR